MSLRHELKATYEPSHVIRPIYTGGPVALSQDGKVLVTCVGEDVLISDLDTGDQLARIQGDGDVTTTLALAPDASFLVLCSRTLSMRIYSLSPSETREGLVEPQLLRSLRPHSGPVVTSAIDASSTLLATGGADGVVKVWDLRRGFSTHTLHGHSGLVSALHFFQVAPERETERSASRKRKSRSGKDEESLNDADEATAGFRLASGGEDGKIRVWNLAKRKSIAVLDSHVSVIRAIDFSAEKGLLLSASRDKSVIVWDTQTWQILSTVPILESVEAAGFVGHGDGFFTGGESSRPRIWDIKGREWTENQGSSLETEAIVDVLHCQGLSFLLSVHADQVLLLHSLKGLDLSRAISTLPVARRISGTHDEIIDLAYVGLDNSLMALATNAEEVRLVNLQSRQVDGTSLTFGADVAQLKGHKDIIITIDTDWSGHWLATGAKDNTARLWRLDPANQSFESHAEFTGHAESISAIALPNTIPAQGSAARKSPLQHPPTFMVTGSQDRTIKKWDLRPSKGGVVKAAYTRKAHDKDMNAIDISHSSAMFATASQDRTVKIWDAESGESIGVLRGHKRGVWTVAFSPPSMPSISGEDGGSSGSRGMVVTGSGDKTVRIWSLNDFSCLRTFEGHTNSVLKVVWLLYDARAAKQRHQNGPQVASAAGDGLVKVWDAQESECAATLDNHIDRVWALAVRPREREHHDGSHENGAMEVDDPSVPSLELVSGAADATVTFWKDTTAETAKVTATRATARIEQDQELQNYVRSKNYREAIVLALQLNHPKRLLELFTSVIDSPDPEAGSLTGRKGVDEVLRTLGDEQLWKLLLRLRDWNSNARTARVAQRIMYAVFRMYPKDRLTKLRRKRAPKNGDLLAMDMVALAVEDETPARKTGRNESIKDVLDGLKAYTDKHLARLEKMAEEQAVLEWTLQRMDESNAVNGVV